MPQHRVGCRVCGAKSSSRFREWSSYAEHEGFQGVEFMVPKSSVICDRCHRAATRGKLKVPHLAPSRPLFSSCILVGIVDVYLSSLSGAQQRFPWPPRSVPRSISHNSQRPPPEEEPHESGDDVTSQGSAFVEGEVASRPAQRKPKLTDRAKMGCYSCGTTRSSRFRRWQDSVLAPKLMEIRAARPDSDEMCAACLEHYRSAMACHEVRPSFAIFTVTA